MSAITPLRLLIALLLLMLVGYIYQGISISKTYEPESQLNKFYDRPFAVLQHYLQTDNIELEVIQGYDPNRLSVAYFEQLDTNTIVVFRLAEVVISEELADSILNWVKRGGFLILSGLRYEETSQIPANQLFEKLAVRFEWPEQPSYLETQIELSHYHININLETEYSFASDFIDKDNDFWSGTSSGTTIVQKNLSEGYVTLMTDVEIWTNSQINEYDNVVFASFLFSDKDKVVIFGSSDQPHWLTSLFYLSPGFMIFLGLALVLGLWLWAIRFGAIQTPKTQNPSSFQLHLEASANYFWQQDKHYEQLTQIRKTIKQDIVSAFAIRDASQWQKVLPALAERVQLPPEIITHSLDEWQPATEKDYVALVKNLQQIRNHL